MYCSLVVAVDLSELKARIVSEIIGHIYIAC
jgi:hypothetical protein